MPQTTTDINAYLSETAGTVDKWLEAYLPSLDDEPKILHEAMHYSVMAGGKRLRPILALAAYEYCFTESGPTSQSDEAIKMAAVALEYVHTYSLIHDDLPCMDDDDLRRGRPTCHKKFGEGIAVLAGDGLHVVAFELMSRTGSLQTVLELASAVGTSGMLGGQMADLEAEGKTPDLDQVRRIHQLKTAALIRASVRIGAILAGADQARLEQLTQFGDKIGLAFQIVDDILDIEGDQDLLGKQVGSDDKNQKATWPAVIGLDQARKDAEKLIDEALNLFKETDNRLIELARYIGQRPS